MLRRTRIKMWRHLLGFLFRIRDLTEKCKMDASNPAGPAGKAKEQIDNAPSAANKIIKIKVTIKLKKQQAQKPKPRLK